MSKRTKIVFNNSLRSLLLKGVSIIISFVLIPISLSSVSEKQYGIILTITSLTTWLAFFDVGLGNGLRNKLGESIAVSDFSIAKKYVSTTYFFVVIIFSTLMLIYTIISPFINWYKILNIEYNDAKNLSIIIYYAILCFSTRFILQLIGVILLADQKSYLNDALNPIANLMSLILVFVFQSLNKLNFTTLIVSLTITPIITLLLYTVIFFNKKYSHIKPSVKYIDLGLRKELLNTGIKFFLLQLVALIILSTSEILIAKLSKIDDVTIYNIVYKIYGTVLVASGVIMTPLWGAFTNAWHQNDKIWIKKTINKTLFINIFLLITNIIIYFNYNYLSNVWLGKTYDIGIILPVSMIIYNFQLIYNNVYSYFLNSIGKINNQLYVAIIGGIINIPLTIYLFNNTKLGLSSICIANIVSIMPSTILITFQTRSILKKSSTTDF